MAYTTIYNPRTHVVESKIRGSLTLDEAKELMSAIIQVAKENNCFLLLSDYREAELNIKTHEIFNVPEIISKLSAAQGISSGKFKRAIVFKNDLENFQFFENVTITNMQNMKIFQDIDEALKWLLGPATK